jgi:tRNA threonylcarbamoyladenosine biosynthesis protein TsaE
MKDEGGEFETKSVEETFALGESFGEELQGGEIVLLYGGLGAGKTVFVKGIASSLDIAPEEISSPTFTLVNRHWEGRATLYHLDLYRLNEGVEAARAVDLDELLTDESAIIVIEWAERLRGYPLPENSVWRVSIAGDGDAPRRVEIRAPRGGLC